MKTAILTTAIALTLAAPAFAAGALESSVGAQPGVYSTAELIQLREAIANGDEQRILFLQNGANPITVEAGAELAATLGVDPAEYSLAELILLRNAIEDGDAHLEAVLRNGGSEIVSTQGGSDSYATAAAILADGDLD